MPCLLFKDNVADRTDRVKFEGSMIIWPDQKLTQKTHKKGRQTKKH